MCGAFQQEDDNKLDREAVNRMKDAENIGVIQRGINSCLLYTSPSPRDKRQSRMPSSA